MLSARPVDGKTALKIKPSLWISNLKPLLKVAIGAQCAGPTSAVMFSQCLTERFLETERDVSEKVKNYHLIPAVLHVFILWQ